MTYTQAKRLIETYHIRVDRDFHALGSMEVLSVTMAANDYRYRAPRGANGSRARYFHAYLQRVIARGPSA
jgi:hypothetical protein